MQTEPNVIYLALYKGRRDGAWYQPDIAAARLSDWIIRLFTRSPYSHCELAVLRTDGQYDCYSSSIRDGGVRVKTMPLSAEKWDLIEIRQPEIQVRTADLFQRTKGQPYDWTGALGIVLRTRHSPAKWFCSEWCAAALGLDAPERYCPNTLALHIKTAVQAA